LGQRVVRNHDLKQAGLRHESEDHLHGLGYAGPFGVNEEIGLEGLFIRR
jgi:hypothetical protein